MNRYAFYTAVAVGLAWRIYMLTNYGLVSGGEVDVYLADEGVVGLMGKHILEGRELPVFFYGQSYLGALEAYCAALAFALFGVSFVSLRLVTFLFSIAVGVAVYHFAYRIYSVAVARWATALVAVAPMYFLQWNLKARGGFVEHILLVFLVMLAFWHFYIYHRRDTRTAFLLGLVSGIALWVNQLVAAYLGVMAMLVLWHREDRRGWTPAVVGLLLGASLLIGYNIAHPLATARSLARKALVLNRVDVAERDQSWAQRGAAERVRALGDGFDKLGIVFGVPPGEGVERLGMSQDSKTGGPLAGVRRALFVLPLAVFAAGLWAARPRRGPGGWAGLHSDQLLGIFAVVTFLVGYVSPRYMLPAYPIAAILAAVLAARSGGPWRRPVHAGLAAVMIFNVASWVDAASLPPAADEDRGLALIELIRSKGISACYSAAPMYHLVFASNETVVLSPLQKDRYPAYSAVVEAADSICYVFRDDQTTKRQHVAMQELLERHHVRYQQAQVGPYRVLYDFTPRRAITAAEVEKVRHQETARVGPGTKNDTETE
ncbi:MAG TPA: glycosyltransferase family 39 protein [Candidatus Limnocylindrales bacterium]|nr:glycosyltransferase family 39 protein [Candidatus Limnocylindrales bacterium]